MEATKLKRAFVEGLGIESSENFDQLAYGQHPKWDSIAHMHLVASLEREFDIMLDSEDVIALSSYAVSQQILRKYGVDPIA